MNRGFKSVNLQKQSHNPHIAALKRSSAFGTVGKLVSMSVIPMAILYWGNSELFGTKVVDQLVKLQPGVSSKSQPLPSDKHTVIWFEFE